MLNKKFEFDLNIADPKETLQKVIEEAGYHVHNSFVNAGGFYTIMTEETANNEKDVLKFIEDVNNVTGLKLVVLEEELIDEENEIHFHTEDGMFGGIVVLPGMTSDNRLPDIDDTRFHLAYSEEGDIFT